MSTFMQVEPLEVEPFLLVNELDETQRPVQTYTVQPPLAVAPRRVKFSESKDQMVTVSDLRFEYEASIGGALDDSPVGGIRVFSPDDNWLFLGGTGTDEVNWPRFYMRKGPGFIENPKRPIGVQVGPFFVPHIELQKPMIAAVFDKTSSFILLTPGIVGDTAYLYEWDGTTWQYRSSSDYWSAAGINRLHYDPVSELYVTQCPYGDAPGDSIKIYRYTGVSLERLPDEDYFRNGRLLTISPDGAHWVFTDGNAGSVPLKVFGWSAGKLIEKFALPGSEGNSRSAEFTPDGRMLIIGGISNTGFDMPIWYDVNGETFTLTGGRDYEAAAGQFAINVAPTSDKVLALSGTRAVVYEPGELVGDDFTDAADLLGVTGTKPTSATVFTLSRDGRYVITKRNAAIYRRFWNGSTFGNLSLTGTEPVTAANLQQAAWSPNGDFYVFGAAANDDNRRLSFLKRQAGSDIAYTTIPFADRPPLADCPPAGAGVITAMDFTSDGTHLVVLTAQTPFIFVYKRTGDAFTRVTGLPTLTGPANDAKYSPDGQYLAFASPLAMWKRGGDSYVVLDPPDIAGTGIRLAWAADGVKLGIVTQSSAVFYRRTNDGLARLDMLPSPTPYAGAQQIAWTPDSRYALIGRNGAGAAAPYLKAIRFDADDDLIETDLTGLTLPTAGVIGLAVQPGTNYVMVHVAGTAANRYLQYTPLFGLLTLYQRYVENAAGGSTFASGEFSPAGDLVHYDLGAVGVHRDTINFLPVADLAFDKTVAPSAITRVLYGNTGGVVVYENVPRNGLGVRPPNSDFINMRDLRGTFVTLYDRKPGFTYRERAYAMHPVDAVVKDIQISKTPKSMSYHLTPPGAWTPDQLIGRLVFDIDEERFNLTGPIYRLGDTSSLFAYSPFESYFVSVTQNEDGISGIRLYRMDTAPGVDMTFTQVDYEEVLYGPPAFSNCETVVVAHGGRIPFSLFARVADELVPREIEIRDWIGDEFVLAIAFTDDCTGLIIVTPDRVVVIGQDPEDPDVWEPTDEFPVDEEEEEPDEKEIEIIDDNLVIITDPGDPKEPPIVGELDPDDKTLSDITYIPYVSVSFTFRTW